MVFAAGGKAAVGVRHDRVKTEAVDEEPRFPDIERLCSRELSAPSAREPSTLL